MKLNAMLIGLAAATVGLAQAETISVNYACDNGKNLQVRYVVGGGAPSAHATVNGRSVRMGLTEAGNDEQDIFKGGGYQLLTQKFYEESARQTEVNQLTRETRTTVNGKRTDVSEIVVKNCSPK